MANRCMILAIFYFITIYISFTLSTNIQEGSRNETLQLVHVLFRHGMRTLVVVPYENDPYVNYTFPPYGWGQITNEGKRELFYLGKWLNRRYRHLLGSYYKDDFLYAKASSSTRTLMSLATVLAGAFQPKNTPMEWNDHLNWQPIPYYADSEKKDIHLRMSAKCPRYDKVFKEVLQLPEVKCELKRYDSLFTELSKHTGQNMTTVRDIWALYIDLNTEKRYGLELPSWTKEYFPHRLLPLAEKYYLYMVYTREMQRIKAGPFLQKMLHEMQAKTDGTLIPKERKMFMYCAHDWTITNILVALKVWQPRMPDFAALVTFELHKNPKTNEYYIEIYYKNKPNDDVEKLTVPGCNFKCPLKSVIELTKDVLPNASYEEMCRPQSI